MEKYVVLDKKIGETPLEVTENWRNQKNDMVGVPLSYAGRLDPMASGKLLVLIGDECKKQTDYHNLDKEYQVTILLGAKSDSGDVLGLIKPDIPKPVMESEIKEILSSFVGPIKLPYPIFSAKTVLGKPLHTWAMEDRLAEISIPTKTSMIYSLSFDRLYSLSRQEVTKAAIDKIDLLPQVTDPRKALGNDFRRIDVLAAWKTFSTSGSAADNFWLIDFTCCCSSGTYMRTLAEEIAKKLGAVGLAFSIHRSIIGLYDNETKCWQKIFN